MLAGMQHRGLGKGDLVILSLEKSSEIIPVLWGCFLGGIIPALLQPPVTFSDYNPAAEKTEKVFSLLRTARVILSHRHASEWRSSHIPAEMLIDIADLEGNPDQARRADLDGEDTAMIQFSSGSTGDPKGVVLSHRNILVNTAAIIKGIALESEDVAVNWMPLYHDMGLIGFHITPVYAGVNQYFIDPVDFVKHPGLWLDMMSRLKCTITACPNFGQMLVNRYLGRRAGHDWDLSSLRIIFNGAEPISVPAMHGFLASLGAYGLPPWAMFPAYGLAEATLAVTFPERHRGAFVTAFRRDELLGHGHAVVADGAGEGMELVNLGRPVDDCALAITDDNGQPVGEGRVGHVQVQGRSVSSGYYANPAATAEAFREGWLQTGDLGFIRNGDLFITGRSKDIIFINGMNYYAHDLEAVAAQLEGVADGRIVMAGTFNEAEGRDQLLIFLAAPDNEETLQLCSAIRNHFSTLLGLQAGTFVLVRPADIPRTSSGKIRRYRLAERYQAGGFEKVIQLVKG